MSELLIVPAHDDIVGARCKGLLGNGASKLCALDWRIDDEDLFALQIDADTHDETCIIVQ